MRARFTRSRGRVTTRGRFFVPVSAAATLALVAGTVVAVNNAQPEQDVALTQSALPIVSGQPELPAMQVGAEFSYNLGDLAGQLNMSSAQRIINAGDVTLEGLPEGVSYDSETGIISGVPTKSGTYNVDIKVNGITVNTVAVTVNAEGTDGGDAENTNPEGTSVNTEANAALSSLGENNPLTTTLQNLLISLGLSGALVSSSLGGGNTTPESPETPQPGDQGSSGSATPENSDDTTTTTGSLGNIDFSSLTQLVPGLATLTTGSTGNTETVPGETQPDTAEGEVTAGSLGNLPGTLGSTTDEEFQPAQGEVSTGSEAMGSSDALVPGLTIAGSLLLGLALLAALNTGSTGSNGEIPLGLGSTGSTGNAQGGTGSNGSSTGSPSSSGSTGPTGSLPSGSLVTGSLPSGGNADETLDTRPPAPGPQVANGRG